MGTKVNSNYEDLLTFTRASGGHALRPVSYGTELVTNGTFDADATGWGEQDNNISVTSVDGEAEVTASSASSYIYNSFPTKVGGIYKITADGRLGSNVTALNFNIRNNSHSGTYLTASPQLTADGTLEFVFVAEAATTAIRLVMFKSANPAVAYWDNVSVKEVLFDQPDGTLTLFEHPVNVPRVEWDSAGNRLGLLVEEARTNLVTYSEDFTNSLWVGNNASVFLQSLASPAGTQDVGVLSDNTANGEHFIAPTFSYTSGTAYTWSAFVKKNTLSYFWVRWSSGPFNAEKIVYNLEDGTIESSTADGSGIEDVGNGWYRVWSYNTADSTGGGGTAFGVSATAGTQSYAGSGNSVYIYGAQLEAGSFPTSYIKSNSGSTTTRSADVASIPVADFGYNQSAGSLLVQCQHFTTETGSTAAAAVALDDGSSNNRMWYYQNKGQWIGSSGGATQFSIVGSDLAEDTEAKAGMVYSKDDFALYIDGSSVGTKTAGSVAEGVATLHVGKAGGASVPLNGHIKSIKYYPRRLTNAQLQALTEPRTTPTLSLTFDGLESSYTENYIHG